MNKSFFEAAWKQLRAHLQARWPQLTEADIDSVAGNFDQFIGLIQTKYDYSHKRAEEEFYGWMTSLGELRAGYVEAEFQRRLARIKARQENYTFTP